MGRAHHEWALREIVTLHRQRADHYEQAFNDLLKRFMDLRVVANPSEPEKVVPAPKRPPAIVYRAMRAISPRDDATFAANWRLWEENQDECDKDPEKFAERIKRGRMTPEQPRAD